MSNPRVRYAKLPAEVLMDERISDKAARLYALIAMHAFEGATASIGVRRLSTLLPRASKSEIHRRIAELEESGHIRVNRGANGQRSFYVLKSAVFAQKQGRETVVRSSPSGVPRMVSVAKEDVA